MRVCGEIRQQLSEFLQCGGKLHEQALVQIRSRRLTPQRFLDAGKVFPAKAQLAQGDERLVILGVLEKLGEHGGIAQRPTAVGCQEGNNIPDLFTDRHEA